MSRCQSPRVKGNGITMASRLRALALLVLAALLAACGTPASPSGVTTSTPAASVAVSPSPSPSASPQPRTTYPVTLEDDEGRQVTLDAEPQRIVSLAPSSTEIVCALDACGRIVGVNDFRDGFPPDVLESLARVPDVASFTGVDREAVVELAPDLVLAAGNNLTAPADIEALAGLGFAVLVLYPESLDEVYANIQLVGEAIDAQPAAASIVGDMRERTAAVVEAVAGEDRPRTFYEVGIFGGSIYTAGEDSFLAALIEAAGGEPITGDAVTTAIQLENLVAADPELILLGDAAYDPTITAASVAARPGWEGMTAVVDGRVLPLPEDVLITRPGPRIVDGLEALAVAIHPGALD
jgi:iron complex transport system substrate-binding protein